MLVLFFFFFHESLWLERVYFVTSGHRLLISLWWILCSEIKNRWYFACFILSLSLSIFLVNQCRLFLFTHVLAAKLSIQTTFHLSLSLSFCFFFQLWKFAKLLYFRSRNHSIISLGEKSASFRWTIIKLDVLFLLQNVCRFVHLCNAFK